MIPCFLSDRSSSRSLFSFCILDPRSITCGRKREETHSPSDRSRRDFSSDRRHLHAVRTRAVARAGRLDTSRHNLDTGDFWHHHENGARRSSPHQARDVSLSWNGVVDPFRFPSPRTACSLATLIWLVAGGIIYTAGVIFFLNERVRYFHFIWHLFVLAGTSCHFLAVLSCARNA